jgi:histidinol-phosphate aminotransferase
MNEILLDRNENYYGPAPACYAVLRRAGLEQLSLYSRSFTRGTKGELAERLSEEMGIPEERLLLSYGSEDMLKHVVHCYLPPGGTMLLPELSWWYYKSLAAEVGGRHVTYRLEEGPDRFLYNVDEIMALYDAHHPHVILIASPNNPTGNTMAIAQLDRLVRHCASSVVVLDEAYYGFVPPDGDHAGRLLPAHARLVVLRTFSKFYALAGLRIGYACVGAGLTKLISFSARYLGHNQLSEQIALAALGDPGYYRACARRIDDDKRTYRELFTRLEGYTPFHSDANFMLVRYPAAIGSHLREGLAARGVVLKFLNDPGLTDCFRVTVGTHEQNAHVVTAIEAIAAAPPVRASPHAL